MSLVHSVLLRAANLAAGTFGPPPPRDAEELIAAATGGTGLAPADQALVTPPLATLLRAAAEEADLSPLGRVGLRFDALRHLTNLRRMAIEEARDPAILAEPIEAPLFITGLPRSGTTFLHRLLGADPTVRAPRAWQTGYPYPDRNRPDRRIGPDRRIAKVQRQLTGFGLLAPGLRSMHPMDACSPQECTEITAQVFQSLRFETVYHIPSYKAWLAAHGHYAAYRFHRRFLQHLQHQERPADAPAPRWVLKCPDHVFALGALRATYPDARLVFLHRDPLKVLPSVAQLTEVLRTPFARHVDRRSIGRQVVEDWAEASAIMVAEARQPTLAAPDVIHIKYRDIVSRPLETVAMIYDHFGLTLSDTARAAMTALIAAAPRGGYGANRYVFGRHGLDPVELRARFAGYVAQFGVEEEPAPISPRPARRRAKPARQLAAAVADPPHAGS